MTERSITTRQFAHMLLHAAKAYSDTLARIQATADKDTFEAVERDPRVLKAAIQSVGITDEWKDPILWIVQNVGSDATAWAEKELSK